LWVRNTGLSRDDYQGLLEVLSLLEDITSRMWCSVV
jgi:hypothetical protein